MFRLILLSSVLCLSACQVHNSTETHSAKSNTTIQTLNTSKTLNQDVLDLGLPVDMTLLQPLTKVIANPKDYLDQRVTLKGNIDKVCKKKGCWADIVSGEDTVRIKVKDDAIVIPLYKLGHDVYVSGTLKRYDMSLKKTIAHLKHMAKDAGETFDPNSVTEPMTFYQLESDAVKIL